MAETAQETKKSSKTIIILLVILILLLIGGIVTVVVVLLNKDDTPETDSQPQGGFTLPYDNGAVMLDEDSLQAQLDAAFKRAKEGSMVLQFKNTAVSKDGEHFECEIGNAIENPYDMYINIYKDDTFEDQILLTGLIPPGSGIYEFDSEIPIFPGEYEAILVLTQVEDDHQTIHSQVSVVLNLKVG